jgi:hypothetical protein
MRSRRGPPSWSGRPRRAWSRGSPEEEEKEDEGVVEVVEVRVSEVVFARRKKKWKRDFVFRESGQTHAIV